MSKDREFSFIVEVEGEEARSEILTIAKDLKKCDILEFADIHFNHDSAVLLPQRYPKNEENEMKLKALDAIVCCYRFAMEYPSKLMLISGHCDRSGNPPYNEWLAQRRAENILNIMLGNRDEWVKSVTTTSGPIRTKKDGKPDGKSKHEDYQMILKWIAEEFDWACDTGDVEDRFPRNPSDTKSRVETFQESWNDDSKLRSYVKASSIKVDGRMGPETWGAFFDIFMIKLADKLADAEQQKYDFHSDISILNKYRSACKFVGANRKTLSSGESHAHDSQDISLEDRRVYIMFFDPSEVPKLADYPDCHKGVGDMILGDLKKPKGRERSEECELFGTRNRYTTKRVECPRPPPFKEGFKVGINYPWQRSCSKCLTTVFGQAFSKHIECPNCFESPDHHTRTDSKRFPPDLICGGCGQKLVELDAQGHQKDAKLFGPHIECPNCHTRTDSKENPPIGRCGKCNKPIRGQLFGQHIECPNCHTRTDENLPMAYYGYDFGVPPPWDGWSTTRIKEVRDAWATEVESNIKRLRYLGIFALRWFLLADGSNYGVGEQAPRYDSNSKKWRFAEAGAPELADGFEKDFEWLLGELEKYKMKLVPSLIDFHWCFPGKFAQGENDGKTKIVKCGRSEVVTDANRRGEFFEQTLKPLLEISNRHKEAIYAWELINEPEGAVKGSGEGDANKNAVIKKNEMVDFIEEGIEIINSKQYGFKSTVGFRRSKTITEWKGSKEFLGVTLHQFHFYPYPPLEPRTLLEHTFSKDHPRFIGEFGTSKERLMQFSIYFSVKQLEELLEMDRWDEITDQSVDKRLELIQKKKYQVAFPWAMLSLDEYTDWSHAEKKIKEYLSK
jgi:DNA-directed RNA polymerase subunit RPC12/RpoP